MYQTKDRDERFQLLAEQINEGLIQIDRGGTIQLANRRFCAIVQYEPREIIEKNLFELIQSSDLEKFPLISNGRQERRLPERFETRVRRRSGRYVWVSVSASPLIGPAAGEVIGHLALLTDISSQKRQENRNQMHLAIGRILGSYGDARNLLGEVLSIIRSGLSWNTAILWLRDDQTGAYERFDIASSRDASPGLSEAFESMPPLAEQAVSDQEAIWVEEVTNGTRADTFPFRTSVIIPLIGRTGPLGAIQLLSAFKRARDEETLMLLAEIAKRIAESLERQLAEERLRRNEAQLAQAQEIAQLGSWIWNASTDRAEWSAELLRIVNPKGGKFPNTFHAYLDRIESDDRERVVRLLDHAFITHEPFQCDHSLVVADGSQRDIHLRGQVSAGEDGKVLFIGTSQDITDRKLLEEEAERARRVDSLGAVSAKIAHEFRNVLMSILPFGEALARSSEEAARKASAHIIRAAHRGRRITDEILRYTRPVEPAFTTIDVRQWLEDLHAELRGHVPKEILVQVASPSEALFILGDAQQLGQVLVNLVLNAKDAMLAGGTIRITARHCLSGDKLHFTGLPTLDRYVHVEVRDTGSGMDAETLRRVFEPMFTTKRHGTGLGLAVVYQIITRHHGHIFVESVPGAGTVFHLLLPRSLSDSVVEEVIE